MKCPLCDYDARDADDLFRHFAFGGWKYHGTSSTAKAVAKAVGIKSYEGGFADVAGAFDAGGLEVVVRPAVISPPRPRGASRYAFSGRDKSSKHRIFVKCPSCGRQIPAGRMHQHVPVHAIGPRPAPRRRRRTGAR